MSAEVPKNVTIDTLSLQSGDSGGPDIGPNAVMQAWFQLFKTAQIHAIENQALHRPIQIFAALTALLTAREGRISLQAKDRALFVNSQKLRLTPDEFEFALDIFSFFEQRGMGGFTIDGGFTEEAVRALLSIMVYAPPGERAFATIDAALKAAGLPIRINKPLGTGAKSDAEVVQERRGHTFFTYSKLVVLYRSVIADEKLDASKRSFLTKKIARTVQTLVDICLEDDHTFLGVSSVKSGDAYEPHHAANTAVLSIALGAKLGLRRVDLADLGMAAVFHDVGLRACPGEILDKEGRLDASEKAMVDLHTLRSVEFLLEERRFTRSALARIVVAFEHHRANASAGARRPDIFSRIVCLTAVFDSLTTTRPWRHAFLPDEALAMMLAEGGKQFDPALLNIFVNAIGLYPVGTLVRLDTGEFGVVIYGGGDGERVSRPVVALLGRDGKPSATADLAERDPGGRYRRSIVATDDPSKYGLQVSGLVASGPVTVPSDSSAPAPSPHRPPTRDPRT